MTDQANIATELETAGVPQDAMRRLAELQPGRTGSLRAGPDHERGPSGRLCCRLAAAQGVTHRSAGWWGQVRSSRRGLR